MLIDFTKVRLFLRPGVTDMRKHAAGLSVVVAEVMQADPLSGNLFLFCNRRRNLLKVVYWDRNGFCLWQKRLEKQKFPWPDDEGSVAELSLQELRWLLEGVDFFHRHQSLPYTQVI